jgi:hypothetical protein
MIILIILSKTSFHKNQLNCSLFVTSGQKDTLPLIGVLYDVKSGKERRGRVVNNPASYSGGTGFKSRPGYRLS